MLWVVNRKGRDYILKPKSELLQFLEEDACLFYALDPSHVVSVCVCATSSHMWYVCVCVPLLVTCGTCVCATSSHMWYVCVCVPLLVTCGTCVCATSSHMWYVCVCVPLLVTCGTCVCATSSHMWYVCACVPLLGTLSVFTSDYFQNLVCPQVKTTLHAPPSSLLPIPYRCSAQIYVLFAIIFIASTILCFCR